MSPARSGSAASLAFPLVIVVTVAVAFLPARWRLGWQTEVARVVQVPLRPFTHAGEATADWLRPPAPASDGLLPDRATLERLVRERDLAEQLLLAEQVRTRELTTELESLMNLPASSLRADRWVRPAFVTRRIPGRTGDTAQVTLRHRDAGGGAWPENVCAVYASSALLGRVHAGEGTDTTTGSLVPLTNAATGVLRGRLVRAGLGSDADGVMVQVEPTGAEAFEIRVDGRLPVAEGDVVRLDDPRWPPAAQGLVIGVVRGQQPDPDEPLRTVLEVRPEYRVADVYEITLLGNVYETGTVLAAPEPALGEGG